MLANIVRLEILDNNRTKDRLVISELALRTRTELDINGKLPQGTETAVAAWRLSFASAAVGDFDVARGQNPETVSDAERDTRVHLSPLNSMDGFLFCLAVIPHADRARDCHTPGTPPAQEVRKRGERGAWRCGFG